MYNMISWWARNPKAANLLMAAIIIVGIATFSRIEQGSLSTSTFKPDLNSLVEYDAIIDKPRKKVDHTCE